MIVALICSVKLSKSVFITLPCLTCLNYYCVVVSYKVTLYFVSPKLKRESFVIFKIYFHFKDFIARESVTVSCCISHIILCFIASCAENRLNSSCLISEKMIFLIFKVPLWDFTFHSNVHDYLLFPF